jgi:hypothetical protein
LTPARKSWRLLVAAGALIACASASGSTTPAAGWTTWGDGTARTGSVSADPTALARDFVLPLDGRITSQILFADGSFFAATSAGKVVSFTSKGTVRWQVDVGQLTNRCAQLDGYGVTGTGAIDPSTSTLYVADAFGRLHALALVDGRERPGFPVRVFTDDRRELVWGALTLTGGAVYVPTASYCDSPMTGGLYRVDLGTRAVTEWVSVPASLGGGGGIWGWGGIAVDPDDGALYAVTANAFSGGSNTGAEFSESAGYGEHLVELDPSLNVVAASHPADLTAAQDLDFSGSPVVIDRPGCGELVLAADKDDELYAWRSTNVAAGPIWTMALEQFDAADPFLSELAWSPALDSIFAVTGTHLDRIAVDSSCNASVAWSKPLGTATENGSPTLAGTTVWFALNGKPTLVAYDGTTGRRLESLPLGGTTLTAPTVVDGRLLVGTFTGLVESFLDTGARSLASATAASSRTQVSWATPKDAWETRAAGVFATENGGHSWHQIYQGVALSILRVSATAGVIETGAAPGPCMCTTRKLWTNDDGATWHATGAIGTTFAGSGSSLYWWQGGNLRVIDPFPPSDDDTALESKPIVSLPDGTIVAATPIAGGEAFLVSNRVGGQSWDTNPRVILAEGADAQTVRLPAAPPGEILAEQITASAGTITVTGTNFRTDPVTAVTWTSDDGGQTWSLE